tara:strand:- start:901 stop:1065 length:165 start_codon:yes stop_codon:yes gene_type:complete
MYACLCNALREKDVHAIRKRCKTKEEFVEELKKLFPSDSCMICYSDVIGMYNEE